MVKSDCNVIFYNGFHEMGLKLAASGPAAGNLKSAAKIFFQCTLTKFDVDSESEDEIGATL